MFDTLKAGGDTALYDTAVAAHRAVLDNYRDDATNLVVLMTDGKNDNPAGGLTLEQAVQSLKAGSNPARPVRLVTVGYGNEADFVALQAMCRQFDALLLVDVSHDLGCLGPGGTGQIGAQGLHGKIDLVMGSFAKSFASNGGFVACCVCK